MFLLFTPKGVLAGTVTGFHSYSVYFLPSHDLCHFIRSLSSSEAAEHLEYPPPYPKQRGSVPNPKPRATSLTPPPNTLAQCLSHCPPDGLSVLDELWLQQNNIWLLELCNYSLINFLKSTYFATELKQKRVPAFRVVSSCGDNKK